MSAQPDPSAALERAVAEHAAARAALASAELGRAKAVVAARRAGWSTRAIAAVLGVSHVRVVQMCAQWAGRVSPDQT